MHKGEKPRANCATKKKEVGEVGVGENLEKREAWGHLLDVKPYSISRSKSSLQHPLLTIACGEDCLWGKSVLKLAPWERV